MTDRRGGVGDQDDTLSRQNRDVHAYHITDHIGPYAAGIDHFVGDESALFGLYAADSSLLIQLDASDGIVGVQVKALAQHLIYKSKAKFIRVQTAVHAAPDTARQVSCQERLPLMQLVRIRNMYIIALGLHLFYILGCQLQLGIVLAYIEAAFLPALKIIGELLLQLQEPQNTCITQGCVCARLLICQHRHGITVAGCASCHIAAIHQCHA